MYLQKLLLIVVVLVIVKFVFVWTGDPCGVEAYLFIIDRETKKMGDWWNGLTVLNQGFYGAALFFSLIFLWQFIGSLIGTHGTVDMDVHVDADVDTDAGIDIDQIEAHSAEEAAETLVSFKLLSVRAILAFFTLFTWAGALYIDAGKELTMSLLLAVVWGLAGWGLVTLLVNMLIRMAETGTQQISSCIGKIAKVYMDIPSQGTGKIRVEVSGAISMVSARSSDGIEIKSGTQVRVAKLLNSSTVSVEVIDNNN